MPADLTDSIESDHPTFTTLARPTLPRRSLGGRMRPSTRQDKTMRISTLTAALGATLLALTLTSCGSDSGDADSASDDTASSATTSDAPDDEAAALVMTDPWVKAAKEGMTAAFGTLVNNGPADAVVASASSDIASAMELHETVENDDGTMAMQPKEGGFTIPAGGEHELQPGGDHLMIMDLERALRPGEIVTVTLTLEDGSTLDVGATVKNFTGADEKYQGEGMDMGGQDKQSNEDDADGM